MIGRRGRSRRGKGASGPAPPRTSEPAPSPGASPIVGKHSELCHTNVVQYLLLVLYLVPAVLLGVPVPLDDPDPGQEGDVHPVLGTLLREALHVAGGHLWEMQNS